MEMCSQNFPEETISSRHDLASTRFLQELFIHQDSIETHSPQIALGVAAKWSCLPIVPYVYLGAQVTLHCTIVHITQNPKFLIPKSFHIPSEFLLEGSSDVTPYYKPSLLHGKFNKIPHVLATQWCQKGLWRSLHTHPLLLLPLRYSSWAIAPFPLHVQLYGHALQGRRQMTSLKLSLFVLP